MSNSFAMTAQQVDDVLTKIQSATGIGGPLAAATLKAVGMMIGVLKNGLAGTVAPDTVLAEIGMLDASLRDNDQAADDALDAKFDKAP